MVGKKSSLFTFKVASFDGSDELRPGKGVQDTKGPRAVDILILKHLGLLECSEVLVARSWHRLRPTEQHLGTHIRSADGHRICRRHGQNRLLKLIFGWIRQNLNFSKRDFVNFHGQNQGDAIILHFLRNSKGLLLQTYEREYNGISF